MKKAEIIRSLLVIESRTSGIDLDGYVKHLNAELSDLQENPSPELFGRLHAALLEMHQIQIEGTASFDETGSSWGEGVATSHRRLIERLRRLAGQIGIIYHEPIDPLLH